MNAVLKLIFNAADNHAQDAGEIDYAVGDLQAILATAWELMTDSQRTALLNSPDVANLVECGARNAFTVQDLLLTSRAEAPSDVMLVLDVDMTKHFTYENPDVSPEWRWIEENAQMRHVESGEFGSHEFLLNIDTVAECDGQAVVIDTAEAAPAALSAIVLSAERRGAGYILFHQGT